jgi:Domain of unknown function (DUF397)
MDSHGTRAWRKSSRCDSATCAEVARTTDGVIVRSSMAKDIELPLTADVWRHFLAGVKHGEFDLSTPHS